jgi:hypothetical protein
MPNAIYYELQVRQPSRSLLNDPHTRQTMERAYVPIRTVRQQRAMYSELELSRIFAYPQHGESTVYLITGPAVVINEQPAEQQEEGTLKKCLSLAIEALKFLATIVGSCVQ